MTKLIVPGDSPVAPAETLSEAKISVDADCLKLVLMAVTATDPTQLNILRATATMVGNPANKLIKQYNEWFEKQNGAAVRTEG